MTTGFHLTNGTGIQILVFICLIFFGFSIISVWLMPPPGLSKSDVERALSVARREAQREVEKELESLRYRMRILEDELSNPRIISPSGVSLMKKKYPLVNFLAEGKRKKILVTGGGGFVGSHLVDRLMREGHQVIVVDNFFTGRKKNVEKWIGHESFDLLHHDVVNPLLIEVDQIYHLASPASPKYYMYNPVKTIKTNTIGTLNMLGLAKRTKATILLASTSEIYGDPEVHPQREDYWGHVNPIGPRACYDEGKRIAETMFYAYHTQDHVDIRVARIFNTYGPRMHMSDGRVVSNFIMQALQGQPITVYGNGSQTRSFMYVSDLVDGLIKLMNSNYTQPVNLGNPDEYSIERFAKKIVDEVSKISQTKSSIKSHPLPKDDPSRRKPDITVAKKHLNWYPQVSLQEGLSKTISYFQGELEKTRHTVPVSS